MTPSEIIAYLRACYVVLEKDNRQQRIEKHVAETVMIPEEQRGTLLQCPNRGNRRGKEELFVGRFSKRNRTESKIKVQRWDFRKFETPERPL